MAHVDHLFGFTGRERDEESGLQFNRARYYDPAVGRWISLDPLGFAAGDSNLSRYVGNSPLALLDPSGLENPVGNPNYIEPDYTAVTAYINVVKGIKNSSDGIKEAAEAEEKTNVPPINSGIMSTTYAAGLSPAEAANAQKALEQQAETATATITAVQISASIVPGTNIMVGVSEAVTGTDLHNNQVSQGAAMTFLVVDMAGGAIAEGFVVVGGKLYRVVGGVATHVDDAKDVVKVVGSAAERLNGASDDLVDIGTRIADTQAEVGENAGKLSHAAPRSLLSARRGGTFADFFGGAGAGGAGVSSRRCRGIARVA